MTVEETIRKLSQFPFDYEVKILYAIEPCKDGDWKGYKELPLKIDFGSPEWYVGDEARLLIK